MADSDKDERDHLTGVLRRRQIPIFIAETIEHSRADNEPLSVIIINIDDLRGINDYHGLPCGDFVIKELARLLAENVPANSLVARSGGGEFTIVLPKTIIEAAERLAIGLQDITAGHSFLFKYNHEAEFRQVSVAISTGAASIYTNGPDPVSSLLYHLVSVGYQNLSFGKKLRVRHHFG